MNTSIYTPQQPTLQTQRLVMRAFTLADAPEVQCLAGIKEIAAMTLTIPHPYQDGMAQEWIKTHQKAFKEGKSVNLAIVLRDIGVLCGAISLQINQEHNHAELGYWIGKPYWGQGYCTEAAKEILRYGFEVLGLHRIHARHFSHNPASGQVMQKIGMVYEGCRRQHKFRWGEYVDIVDYGILKSDWQTDYLTGS
ncbi:MULTISPECIES: GNAT family N-acetyltransferase [unclassified Nostoc]|uniref:GNAT family N-acetyltransferase n=1 Tax=unclassified Nostoc TaxID=2593658 RepID=UPI000CF35AE0|nr:GNAT family N-acetyltransferase [Nostoc sp. 'Peltigera membranacea cyanobiont' N6]AVH64119.1 GCN5-related N-acetyltransferase [Nostoc sp. 'Peltigera membranacea cyanobiont' N6]